MCKKSFFLQSVARDRDPELRFFFKVSLLYFSTRERYVCLLLHAAMISTRFKQSVCAIFGRLRWGDVGVQLKPVFFQLR